MELMWFKRSVAQRNRGKVNQEQLMDCDVLDVVDYLIEHFGQGGGLKLAITTLHLIDRRPPAEELELRCRRVLIRHELQEHHKRHYEVVFEALARPGRTGASTSVFRTEVVVGRTCGVNTPSREVLRDVEPKYGEPRRAIRLNDVLRSFPSDGKRVRVAVLSGVAIAGLSYAAHKLALDWSHEAANQDVHFLFYLNCQDLRHYAAETLTLLKLLRMFHHALDDILPLLRSPETPCALVLEGWEERRPLLDTSAPPVTDPTQEAPLSALMASLLRGDLMPHMRLVITCRRSDLYLLPQAHIDRVLEVRGYLPAHRDEFFLKHNDRDLSVGQQVLPQVKRSPTLYALSHLPLFAWIVVWVFERNVRRKPSFYTRPPHETPFMVDIVLVMVNRWQERYRGSSSDHTRWKDEEKNLLKSLGHFALRMIEARRVRFHGNDFKEFDLEPRKLLNLGLITEEMAEWTPGGAGGASGTPRPTYVFLHLALQEFMAAFYVYLAFRADGRNVFEQQLKSSVVSKLVKDRPILDLLRPATDRALASPDGHLDLMLRFLCGMAMDSTEDHLRGTMLPHRNPPPRGMDEAERFLRKRMETAHPDRRRNLELCLNEMKELEEDKQESRHMGF
ncbi:hypothetical protein AALO_G00206910 [Alosa alosa]|uniref:Uncharacterized protein n=1 Tax=Alosa alosa TaxID=278164 RepID=A0AAV6G4I8_9TELE|nr:hypothetical protein AALO_G00206910 [Alosa alosa]